MTNRFFFLSLTLSLVLICGCGGVKKPEGFPSLIRPVTVKIHKGGTPLNDITVVLFPQGSSSDLFIAGTTGPNGVATLRTERGTYSQQGVPVGKYLVQLNEAVKVEIRDLSMDATPQESAAWEKEYNEKMDKARSFPRIYSDVAKSPLEMDVSSSPVSVEFDVSK